MIFQKSLLVMALGLAMFSANAQDATPKGFKTGTITLANGNNVAGFVKDNIRSNASIVFLQEQGGKKIAYDGTQLNAIEIEGVKFICINTDFFKVLSEGDLNFLQKSSDAKGKIFYNGTEAVASSGTDGKPGDYFIYRKSNNELKLITNKNLGEVISTSFENYSAAIEKAHAANGDPSQLKAAVDIYNKRNTN
jgi:hypothetical protein